MGTLNSLIARALRMGSGVLILSLFLFGCSPATPSPTTVPASETPPPSVTLTPAPDYVTRVRNAEYQLGATDALRVVQLNNGYYEEGTPADSKYVSVTAADFVAAGDLNGDGANEIVMLVAENYGGSGVFTFLALYKEESGDLQFQTSVIVDDRPGLNALSIENGEIFLDATIHSAEDPFCCPTLKTTRHYRWSNSQLTLSDYATFTPDGRPRTITIEVPVRGTLVNSTFQIKGQVAIAPFENNLVYRIYSAGDVELEVGSIMVKADDLGGPGTFDTFITMGNIFSGAAIRIVVQDVSAADGSLLAMDSVELVVK